MKKNRGILSLVVTVALIALMGFTVLVGFGKTGTGAMKNIKLGLDLAGGVSITYQVKDKNPTEEEMSDTIYKLQKRVEQYSTEASVYQEGSDRINIEIPGVTDANKILDELGKPGALEFKTQDGETVITGSDVETASAKAGEDSMGNREYSVELNLNDSGKEKFAKATEENVGKTISIIYDNNTISSPRVNEAITGGQAYITGNFTFEEADNLASTIRIGGLKLELEELRSNVVGAQLGEHRYDNTDRQRLSESLYRTGSSEPQNRRRDQSRYITVHNSRHRLLETGFQRILHTLSPGHLFPYTREDNNIRVHRHTDTQDNTCNTRQRQRNVESVQD